MVFELKSLKVVQY